MEQKAKYNRYRGMTAVADSSGRLWIPGRPRIERWDYPDNRVHIATQGEDCMLLAYEYLEDERFWWVIAMINGIFNPLYTFEGGELLTIPSIQTLHGEILPRMVSA